jgi:hypothetical protein
LDVGGFAKQGIKNIRLKIVETNDMTIHWKGLDEHFLMVPLLGISFSIQTIWGESQFSEFFSNKPQSLKS